MPVEDLVRLDVTLTRLEYEALLLICGHGTGVAWRSDLVQLNDCLRIINKLFERPDELCAV